MLLLLRRSLSNESIVIEYVVGERPTLSDSAEVEFIGGPHAGERDYRAYRPLVIPMSGGAYRRGVSCADDGVLRYIWVATKASVR